MHYKDAFIWNFDRKLPFGVKSLMCIRIGYGGYASEDHIIGAFYEQEAKQYLDEINQIFFKLHPDLQILLLPIVRELMTSDKNTKK